MKFDVVLGALVALGLCASQIDARAHGGGFSGGGGFGGHGGGFGGHGFSGGGGSRGGNFHGYGFAGGGWGHGGNFHGHGFSGAGWGQGSNFHGHGFAAGGWGHGGNFHGHNGNFHGNRRFFFGPGFGFYAYPWWPWWWDYYYPAGPYYGYDGGYYDGGGYNGGGYDVSYDPQNNSGGYSSQFNSTRAVQAALAWRGFYNGRIDGVMGPETRSAIEAFQKRQGLTVTGEIDSNLTKALQRSR